MSNNDTFISMPICPSNNDGTSCSSIKTRTSALSSDTGNTTSSPSVVNLEEILEQEERSSTVQEEEAEYIKESDIIQEEPVPNPSRQTLAKLYPRIFQMVVKYVGVWVKYKWDKPSKLRM